MKPNGSTQLKSPAMVRPKNDPSKRQKSPVAKMPELNAIVTPSAVKTTVPGIALTAAKQGKKPDTHPNVPKTNVSAAHILKAMVATPDRLLAVPTQSAVVPSGQSAACPATQRPAWHRG